MPQLTKWQKFFLAAVGCVIVVVQLVKFSDYGLEGTGWVFSLLISALLILPALSLIDGKAHAAGAIPKAHGKTPTELLSQNGRTQKIFAMALDRAKELQLAIPKMSGLEKFNVPGLEQINRLMMEHWLQYCIPYVICLAVMAEYRKDSTFIGSNAFAVLYGQAIKEMVREGEELAKRNNLIDKFDPASAERWAIKDMREAEGALKHFMDGLANKIPDPDSPYLEYLIEKLKLPKPWQAPFRRNLQEFTRNTLTSFASV